MFRKFAQAAMLCMLAVFAAPDSAQAQWGWGWWWPGGNGNGNGNSANDPEWSVLEETVPYTGRTHLVLVVGDAVFPSRTYGEYGDRILFVNKRNADVKINASNDEWSTGKLDQGDSYVLLLQQGVQTQYREEISGCYYNCNNGIAGDYRVHQTPQEVDYWGDTIGITELLPLFNVPVSSLNDALSTLDAEQVLAGVTNTVLGLLGGN